MEPMGNDRGLEKLGHVRDLGYWIFSVHVIGVGNLRNDTVENLTQACIYLRKLSETV